MGVIAYKSERDPIQDHAGNLIDDGNFVYIYDAWNRLVKVRCWPYCRGHPPSETIAADCRFGPWARLSRTIARIS